MGCFFHSDASGNIVFVLGHDLHPGFDISVILDDHHIFSFQLYVFLQLLILVSPFLSCCKTHHYIFPDLALALSVDLLECVWSHL